MLLQVAQRYAATVAPFLKSCTRTADVLPPSNMSTQALYLWATAIISSYSFTIGSDRYNIPHSAKHPTLQSTHHSPTIVWHSIAALSLALHDYALRLCMCGIALENLRV